MPNKDSNGYIIFFSVSLVVVVGLLLSVVAQFTKPFQTENVRLEKMQNILQSVKIEVSREDAESKYQQIITKSFVVNINGDVIDGVDAFSEIDLARELKKPEDQQRFPIYIASVDGTEYYILPMRGVGLWGPIWGFVSIENDRNTIFGATFDHKSETPGLGAEITENFFTDAFKGKRIFDNEGNFKSIEVAKSGKNPAGYDHGVDAISGGTITSNGVDKMLYKFLGVFKVYTEKQASNVKTEIIEEQTLEDAEDNIGELEIEEVES